MWGDQSAFFEGKRGGATPIFSIGQTEEKNCISKAQRSISNVTTHHLLLHSITLVNPNPRRVPPGGHGYHHCSSQKTTSKSFGRAVMQKEKKNVTAPSNQNHFSPVQFENFFFIWKKKFHLSALLLPSFLPSVIPPLSFSTSQHHCLTPRNSFEFQTENSFEARTLFGVFFRFAAADSRHLFLLQKQTNSKHVLVHVKLYKLGKKVHLNRIILFHCIAGQRILV